MSIAECCLQSGLLDLSGISSKVQNLKMRNTLRDEMEFSRKRFISEHTHDIS
jgi:hypothetical protein